MKSLGFPKCKRLVNGGQFRAVFATGVRVADMYLTLYAAANDLSHARLGVSAGKSCGPAVARNRLKRLVREAFRLNRHCIPTSMDYVVLVQPARDRPGLSCEAGFWQVCESLLELTGAAAKKIQGRTVRP